MGEEAFSSALLARLADFFTEEAIQWPRRLWDVGSVLALEEMCEIGAWEAHGVLSPSAADWQRKELIRIIGPDVGLGERELRRELTQVGGFRNLARPGGGWSSWFSTHAMAIWNGGRTRLR